MADDENEIRFAKKLASNDGGKRRQAMKGVSAWLDARSKAAPNGVLAELELRKLWRGLFFSMWFADGAKVQNELAGKISSLVHNFQTAEGVAGWLQVTGRTMRGEWGKLDKYRIDKFYMLLRHVVRETFLWLSKRKFKQAAPVSQALCATFFAQATLCPAGIRLHIVDLYADELTGVGGAALTTSCVLTLYEPLLQELTSTPDKVFFARALRGSIKVLPNLLKESCPNVELAPFQAKLFDLASDPATLDRYRPGLYEAHAVFQSATGKRTTAPALDAKPKKPAAQKGDSKDSESEEDDENDEDSEEIENEEMEEDSDEEEDGEESGDEDESDEDDEEEDDDDESEEEEAPPLSAQKLKARAASPEPTSRVMKRKVSFGANQSLDHVASIKALKNATPNIFSPSPAKGILSTRVATPGKALKKTAASETAKSAQKAPPSTPASAAKTSAKKKGAASTPRRKASDFF